MLHAHHIVPVSKDGLDTAANLIVLCPNCHAVAHWVTRQVADVGQLTRDTLQVLMSQEVDTSTQQAEKRGLVDSVRPFIDKLRSEMRS